MKTKIDKKRIGNYKIKFQTEYNNRSSDFLFLKISISNEFQKILKEAVIKEDTKDEYHNGKELARYTRYKVRRRRTPPTASFNYEKSQRIYGFL